MNRNYILPLIAGLGVIIAVVVIIDNNQPTPKRPLVIQPSLSPYASVIAGVGIVEASTGNIAIGTPVPGIATKIYVKVGDHVKAGDALFKIDDRDLQAQLLTALAKVNEAVALLQKPMHRLEYLEQLEQSDSSAVSKQNLSDLRDDVAQADAAYELAKAQAEQIKTEINRRTVRAPTAGQVLQLHMRLGEYVDSASTTVPMLLFGGDSKLYVRVNIDETESWRFQSEAKAVAFVRGNSNLNISLQFEYFEPYIKPKTSLSGLSTERTDVRVLQVIYSFDHAELPVYVGQQLDVFIQANSVTPKNTEMKN